MVLTPATIIVVFIIGVLVLLSAVLSRPAATRATQSTCRGCGHVNAREAKYCGRCGEQISNQQ